MQLGPLLLVRSELRGVVGDNGAIDNDRPGSGSGVVLVATDEPVACSQDEYKS